MTDVEIPPEALRLSKSKILELIGERACPFKYKLKHIDCIPEIETEFAEYADDGTAFHKVVAEFFQKENPEIETAEYDPKYYLCLTHCAWWDSFIDKFVKGYLLENLKFKPYLIEHKIYDPGYNFSAIADVIFINKDGQGMTLIDWKTSGSMKSREEAQTELSIYVFMMERSGQLPLPITKVGMFYPKLGRLFIEDVDRKLVESVPSIVDQAREVIKKGVWEKNTNSCFFCSYGRMGVCGNGFSP